MRTRGITDANTLHNHYTRLEYGIGAFQYASDDPEELDEIWSKLEEPELERRHRARLEPVDAAFWRSFYWSLGGLGGMGAGLGTAAIIQDDAPTAAAVSGLTGLAVGLVAVVAASASLPSAREIRYADARRRLLIRGEDDLVAAARGIDRANARRRRHCGEEPTLPGLDTAPSRRSASTQPLQAAPASAAASASGERDATFNESSPAVARSGSSESK